jgi:hypothetical protein
MIPIAEQALTDTNKGLGQSVPCFGISQQFIKPVGY